MAASNTSQMDLSTGLQEPLVSVLIPSYNRLAYVKEAIESAVGQTYQNVEILVFDDYIIDEIGKINYPETEKVSKHCHRTNLKEGVYQPFCKLAIVESAVSPAAAAVIRKDVFDWDDIPSEIGGRWDVDINYLCC